MAADATQSGAAGGRGRSRVSLPGRSELAQSGLNDWLDQSLALPNLGGVDLSFARDVGSGAYVLRGAESEFVL